MLHTTTSSWLPRTETSTLYLEQGELYCLHEQVISGRYTSLTSLPASVSSVWAKTINVRHIHCNALAPLPPSLSVLLCLSFILLYF